MPGKIFAQQQILDGESLQFIALFRRKGPSNVAGLRASAWPPIFTTSKNIEFCYELGLTTLEPVSTTGPNRAGYRTSPALGQVSRVAAFVFGIYETGSRVDKGVSRRYNHERYTLTLPTQVETKQKSGGDY
jgi:hypothetical protein